MENTVVHKSGKFYGVYLLCSQNPEKRYNGKCYIGFTVNPNRRINQHNRGKDFGGARKTSNKGPWLMVMIVHGFPNNISALQFEWAWQQPTLSSRLKMFPEIKRKLPKESHFQYNFRIVSRMLQVGPWNRLPLTIRWLETDYERDFDISTLPPSHMKIVSGKIAISKQSSKKDKSSPNKEPTPRPMWALECHLCMEEIKCPERSRIGCLNSLCKLTCHIVCLANHLIAADDRNRGHYIPIGGQCPLCETEVTWAALLQRKTKIQFIQGNNEYENYEDGDDDTDEFFDDCTDDEVVEYNSDIECISD